MTYFTIIGILTAIFGGWGAYLLRKGGPWNPIDPSPTKPDQPGDSTDGGTVFVPNTPVEPIKTPVEPHTYPNATVTNLCLGIKDMEGSKPEWHNPGNCRYFTGGYMNVYGDVKKTPSGFAIFPTYEQGWLYLNTMIKGKIYAHPNWTLLQLFENYAPESDGNDPVHYSKVVAKRMGVDNSFVLKNVMLV